MSDDIPEPTLRILRIQVTCVPGERHFAVYVDFQNTRDGVDYYSVTDGYDNYPGVLSRDFKWKSKMKPYSHSPSWRKSRQFPLDEAIELAKAYAPHHTVNGFTVADGIRMKAARDAREAAR